MLEVCASSMRKVIEEKLPDVADEVKDEVADLIIDFLEKQSWPMEVLTPMRGDLGV